MRTRHTATLENLRLAIDCLPRQTRAAMLDGIRRNRIIAGAYTSRDGICPMLAAHRSGGRTDCIAFAKAWDAFAFRGADRPRLGLGLRVRRRRAPRTATERELRVLTAHLEASLLEEPGSGLAAAIADHRRLVAGAKIDVAGAKTEVAGARTDRVRPGERPRPGDRDRATELRTRAGWSWLRVFRRYDDYERALALVAEHAPDAPEHAAHPAA